MRPEGRQETRPPRTRVEQWLATLVIPDDWREDIERLQRREARREEGPKIDSASIEAQRRRLVDAYIGLHIGREEFVDHTRALDVTLRGGLPQPTYSEIVLVEAKRALQSFAAMWRDATPAERAELIGATLKEVRVRDKAIVSAAVAEPEYAALVASSEARHLRVVEGAPRTDSDRRGPQRLAGTRRQSDGCLPPRSARRDASSRSCARLGAGDGVLHGTTMSGEHFGKHASIMRPRAWPQLDDSWHFPPSRRRVETPSGCPPRDAVCERRTHERVRGGDEPNRGER